MAEAMKTYRAICDQSAAIARYGLGDYIKKEAIEKILSSSLTLKSRRENTNWTEAILPLVKARSILMKAGHDINTRGLQAEAENMDLEAGNDVKIEAAQEQYSHKENTRTIGVHAHATFDPTKDEFGLCVGVKGGYASQKTQNVTQKNAHLNTTNFKVKAGNVLNVEGAVINTKDADIKAKKLHMKSLADTSSGHNKSISGGVDYNFATEKLSIHGAASKGSHKSANVKEQTGINATGTLNAKIEDLTHLEGAYLDANEGVLDTDRFIYDDVEEVNQSKQMGFSFSNVELSKSAGDAELDAFRQSKNQKNRLKAGVAPGIQIITNADISNLNRDLKNARKYVKNHKHYARVVVPIPGAAVGAVMEGFAGIGERLKRAFDVLTTDQVSKFVRNEIAEDAAKYDEIMANNDWCDARKEEEWHLYKATKDAERYGIGYLSGKDLDGNDRYGEVRIVEGKAVITYAVYQKEVLAERLAKDVLAQAMDVVDRILEKLSLLVPFYKEWMSYLEDDDGTPLVEVDVGTKLGQLNLALKSYMDLPTSQQDYLKTALDLLEDFVKDADEETKGIVEVRFLEGMWWWAEDKESEAAEKYGDYFFECLGPTCRRLCKENKEYWEKLNRERQEEIDKKYAALQRDYEERKKSEED